MIATRQKARPIDRNIFTSTRTVALVVAVASAVALTAAFPKLDLAWIAPLAMAGLFWSWLTTPARSAFGIGFLSGAIFFAIMYSWFGVTAARLVGPYGFLTVLGPALADALAFAFAAAAASLAFARAPGLPGALAGAAAFALMEWARSVGMLGVPFAQIGYSQASSLFAALAAYGGSLFVTFIIAAIGALVASALVAPQTTRQSIAGIIGIAILTFAANLFWPARHAPPPTITVSAIQGNIKQSVKWDPQSFIVSVQRYLAMTASVASAHPEFVLWPETVITGALGDDDNLPANNVAAVRDLRSRFGALAKANDTTIAVGSLELSGDGLHNALYFFAPSGILDEIYRKRQLVPYAEWIPAGKSLLGWFPYLEELGRQVPGRDPAVVAVGALEVAPLICWESAFADVVHDQVARGATLLAIATDDGWFGESAGPYQHAQIAQMRAIENGEWVVRAAATGVSGIIAPDGRWTQRTGLDEQTIVTGLVGKPAPAWFARIGPWPVAFGLLAWYLLVFAFGRRWANI
ncbi:MAG: apolipoprotein N-acyltransferase [Candidatus Eremiobacteraeota bacterium]|nr:apolipoprotein N-acyltransferase [Candidatus Eremiobacteraeota bacterium]